MGVSHRSIAKDLSNIMNTTQRQLYLRNQACEELPFIIHTLEE